MRVLFNLLALRCKNISVSLAFYEKLGLTFINEKYDNDPEHYSSEMDGVLIANGAISTSSRRTCR